MVLMFAVVAVASNNIAQYLQKFKLPVITGFLVTGVIIGPHFLKMVPDDISVKLNFINSLALSFIAFAAGSELYIKEIKNRLKSIVWISVGQLTITMLVSGIGVYYCTDYIPIIKDLGEPIKIAVSILAATIFVGRSPATLIAIIKELKAKGPFTSTILGVTVLQDFLVILVFSINFSIVSAYLSEGSFDIVSIAFITGEILVSFLLGIVVGKLLQFIMSAKANIKVKTIIILLIGLGVFMLSDFIKEYTTENYSHVIRLESLLICIIASFYLTNYTPYKLEFHNIIEKTGPTVYVLFFTLIGTSIEVDILLKIWPIAIVLFSLRLVAMFTGSYFGGVIANNPVKHNKVGWMTYITQAGIGIGLSAIIADAYPDWGKEFEIVIISIIILNLIAGPPMLKFAINYIGESNLPKKNPGAKQKALIFGLENQSITLAKQLFNHGWEVTIATRQTKVNIKKSKEFTIKIFKNLMPENLKELEFEKAQSVITLMTDIENHVVCRYAYENFGVKNLVVRLHSREFIEMFDIFNARIIDPDFAIVNLLDSYVRSPEVTSILLGNELGQEATDISITNPNIDGLTLRELNLPTDVIVLSIKRVNQSIISHGYTVIKLNDVMTVVGSPDSLSDLKLRFEI